MHHTVSIVINCPVSEVFQFVTHVENQARWQASTIENTQTSPGPMGVGAMISHTGKWLGRRFEATGQVIEYMPDEAWAYKGTSGPYQTEMHYHFEPYEGGTQLTMLVEGEDQGFFRLAGPLLSVLARRMLQGDLARLKMVMESGKGD